MGSIPPSSKIHRESLTHSSLKHHSMASLASCRDMEASPLMSLAVTRPAVCKAKRLSLEGTRPGQRVRRSAGLGARAPDFTGQEEPRCCLTFGTILCLTWQRF